MSRIKIFSRIRPSSKPFQGLQLSGCDNSVAINIGFHDNVTKRPQSRYSQAPPSSHNFKFSRVFDQNSTQDEVFEHVARHMVDNFLGGYNGTVFAYGQTSSGKTYTIEGSSRSYAERGLIPRSVAYVFEDVERRRSQGEDVSVHVSYMEIYQDVGYDLLNPGTRPGALMVTLPKVQVIEGVGGEVVVRNLSVHLAASEDVAMSLLFQGSTCRRVAETSMNQHSSRSHTVFTLMLAAKSPGKEAIVKSKLHLVDLAGSERVAKTGADGLILQEAKHINLSLHHLEHVIVSLQNITKQHRSGMVSPGGGGSNDSRIPPDSPLRQSYTSSGPTTPTRVGHVPYRNSMLTMVLKDSLGGNCLTAMIATISAEEKNIWESVSTCRFSQRVACISNQAKRNEELDDKVVIKRLRKRVAELEAELVQAAWNNSQETIRDEEMSLSTSQLLSPQEKKACHQILNDFFHGRVDNPVSAGINSVARFQESLSVMKDIVLHTLKIQKHQQPDKDKTRTDRKLKGKRKKLRSDETPEYIPTAAAVSSSESASMSEVVVSPVSPSSQSRMSSGFGSLQGEGSSDKLETNEVWGANDGFLRGKNSGTQDSESVKIEKQHRRQAWVSQHSPHSTDTQLTATNTSAQVSPVFRVSTNPTAEPETPPSHRISGPLQLSLTSLQHHQSHGDSRRNTGGVSVAASVEAVQDEFSTSIKQSELTQSREEEKRLQQHLHLANLQLQGQQLKDVMEDMTEKLASQHALVKKLERSNMANVDDIHSEKIVEQQLRIKQAKLYHKWQAIQKELKSHCQEGHSTRSTKVPSNSSSFPSTADFDRNNQAEVRRPNTNSKKGEREVEEELEHLKMSRMQKELKLREAATRMKIRALKHQLMSGPMTSDPPPATLSLHHSPNTPDHNRQHCLQQTSPNQRYIQQTSPSQRYIQQAYQILNTSSQSMVPDRATPSMSHTTTPTTPSSIRTGPATSSHHGNSHTHSTPPEHIPHNHRTPSKSSPKSHAFYKQFHDHISSSSRDHMVSPTPSSTAPTHPDDHAALLDSNKPSHTPITRQQSGHTHTTRSPSDHPSTNGLSPPHKLSEKLSLPEEIKETEYMSAIQRQKARVNRIRRCMIAATVIQRAWRKHKSHTIQVH